MTNDEHEDRIEAIWLEVKAKAEAWRAQWPSHCRACAGWGGHSTPATFYSPEDYDPCEAIGPEFCHRCGYEGFDEDHEGLIVVHRHTNYYDHFLPGKPAVLGCFWCHHADNDGEPSI